MITALSDEDERPRIKVELSDNLGSLKGVLVHFKSRRGPKKSVCWRLDKDLEAIRYFDLDETERGKVGFNDIFTSNLFLILVF